MSAAVFDRFEQLVCALPEPTLVVSRDGTIEWLNPAAAELPAKTAPRAGAVLGALLAEGEKELLEYLRLCSLTSGVTLGGISLRMADGAVQRWRCEGSALRGNEQSKEARWIALRLRTLQSAGGRFALLNQRIESLTRELRERRRVEREHASLVLRERQARDHADRANRLKDEFLATLSHELRTPLNAILGWAHLMRADPENAREVHERGLETIERNARLQSQLIHDLLDLSRITSGMLRLNVQPVELLPLLREARESVLPASEAKQIRIRTRLDPDGATVSGDPDRLRQIVWNLLSNAVKFTPRGGSVQLALRRTGSHIEISVSDSGQGIAADVLPQLFERFHQGDSSSTRRHRGLGLGLAIVRYLAELHGGTVSAASEGEGRGATFTVSLPVPAIRKQSLFVDPAFRSPPLRRRSEAPGLERVRLLVIEDDPDSRELLVALLERSGAEVRAVGSASEGLRAARQDLPDVVISDIEMPEEDGYSFIRRLRESDTESARALPAIALTAYTRPEDRARALQAGFQLHLTKPVDPSQLLASVGRLARGS